MSRFVPAHNLWETMPPKSNHSESDFTISENDRDRIIKDSGILEKLPADFIPFDPTKSNPFGTENPFVSSSASKRPLSQASTSKKPESATRRRQGASSNQKQKAKGKERVISTSNDGKIQELETTSEEQSQTIDPSINQWSDLIQNSDEDSEGDDGSDTSSRYGASNAIDDPTSSTNAETLYKDSEADSIPPHVERFLDLIIWTIPFGFLYVMLDIMIHQQYAEHPTAWEEIKRVAANIPIFAIFIYYTMPPIPASRARSLNFFFFAGATVAGSSFLYVFHTAKFRDVIRQTPPLGVLWVYCIVRTDLTYSVVSLLLVGFFIWFMGLPLIGE